jgi:hypothetical protein
MWWLHLGIRHERIEPGCPEQNGRHERMHQTLKQETATPPAWDLRAQQERFRKFEVEYNQLRPHEALGNRPPASVYKPSTRVYPTRLPELEYPEGVVYRKVSYSGSMRWNVERTYVSEVLAGEWVGLLEIDDDLYDVYYGPLLLGWFSGDDHVFEAYRPPPQRTRKRTQAEGE